MVLQQGQKISIKENLEDVLTSLQFHPLAVAEMTAAYVGTEQVAYCLWEGEEGQVYVTIDLCCEIPVQCCEAID